ncbi:unnamed protein product [Echinostoma caproni]|uniref:Phosphatidylinositol-glycan biosynthesis class X protein n=1 Tax=Echinostoma caproni TaxID=27848 RepID=A0A183BGG3_9TREM|nr:unnamed protein product [Echinostoma caproni]
MFLISAAFYVDPYELAMRQPGLNFTLHKPRSRGNDSSVLGRWLSWFSGSEPPTDDTVPDLMEVPMNRSEVDVEAPAWMSDAMTLCVHPPKTSATHDQSYPVVLEVPMHIRYRLPKDDDTSIDRTALAHPTVKCDDGFEYNTWNSVPPFELPVPVPPTSDLLFVMPVTILLLTVGVIVLLVA